MRAPRRPLQGRLARLGNDVDLCLGRRSAKKIEVASFLGQQRQCFRWPDILDITHVPIVRQMLPFSEPVSHKWPMFRFFDCNQEIGAGQNRRLCA